MNSLEKWMILTPIQKLANNVGDLGKIIVATIFEWLPKVQKIAKSGHTAFIQQEARSLVGLHELEQANYLSNGEAIIL